MITKTITGANTKFFVEYANDLIKTTGFDKTIASMILDAYESGIDPMQLKEYLRATMDFTVMNMLLKTDREFNDMIERRNNGGFNLDDAEVLACAAHEAWKSVTK
ncbi:hypothetical protein pzkkv8_207 [Klebsiella phage pzk-kv8]|jgi:hypothetical protein|nr:hypothetical protein pzkkv8_207 [Klebsiella phage pzk-kv8]